MPCTFACAFTMFAGAAFTDSADIKATEAVDTLSALGVIDGYTDGSFKPNGTVTRAEMAKMIFVVWNGGKSDASAYQSMNSAFADTKNHWAAGYGKIGGLPEKAANLINKTKDNAKIERIKDALINIIGHNRTSGDLGIPDFTSEFQFSNGAFSVADSGFTVDMAALDRRLTPQPHDNMYSDMYEYSFRKVL